MTNILRIVEKASGEAVEEIDVSKEDESGVRLIKRAILTQLNFEEYKVEEVE